MVDSSDLLQVLVIDDDEDLRKLMCQILLPQGHQVFAVGSAEEGLELLPYHTFDVAFLDQNLPGMEGNVLGEYLRKNNPQMQVALVTGEEDARLDRWGASHDVSVIHKPFEVSQILDVVDAYRAGQAAQARAEVHAKDPDFAPHFQPHLAEAAERFAELHVADRVADRLVQVIRASLLELRSERRYDESHRITALTGLLTLRVLGIKPPKGSGGLTLFEEYDELMRRHERRCEFSEAGAADDPVEDS